MLIEMTNEVKAIDDFLKELETARANEYIRKPIAWALYQTWKKYNEIEKPRRIKKG